MPKKVSEILNQLNDSSCEVYLYGIIGRWMDIDTNQLIPSLEQVRKGGCTNFTFYVNSDGGEVTQGQALWNYLNRNDINVTWIVDGIAASMAALVMTNPKHTVLMCPYSKLMLHNASGAVCGNSKDIRAYADVMDLFQKDVVDMLATRCELDAAKINSLYMDGSDHWLTPEMAVQAKLCNEIIDGMDGVVEPPPSLVDPSDIYNYFQNQIINLKTTNSMDHKKVAPILNLDVNSDEGTVFSGIQNVVAKATRLETENTTLKTEKAALETQVSALNQTRVKNLIDGGISSKRFGEDMRATYTEMATENYDRTEKLINSLPSIGKVVDSLNAGSSSIPATEKDWTWDQYHKAGKLQNLKATNMEHFKNLFKAKFNRDYKED